MPYCPVCGIETIGKFCSECGQEVPTRRTRRASLRPPPPQQPYYQQPAYQPLPETYYKKPRSKSQDFLIALIIVIIIIAIFGAIFLVYLIPPDNPDKIDVQMINDSGYDIRVYLEVDGEDMGSEFLSSGESEWAHTDYSNDKEHTIEFYFYHLYSKRSGEIITKSDVKFTIDPDLVIMVTEI